jgi:hypothetical protein
MFSFSNEFFYCVNKKTGAFGVGNAMSSSGLASTLAKGIVKIAEKANIGSAGIVGMFSAAL